MATKIQELVAEFSARLANFKTGIKQGITLVEHLDDVSKGAFNRIRASANRMSAGVVDSFKAIDRAATRTALVVGGSMTVMAGATVKLGADFIKTKDTALMAFEAMLGSGEQAMAFYERLEQFERETPFEMPGLLKAAQRLLATKMAAEKVIPALRSIGDAVALTGGGAEQIDRAVVALSQMSAKQKISFEEMNQLAEAGVFAWEALATTLGVDVPTAMDMATKKGNEVYQHFDRFLLEIGKSAEGAMSKQSKMLTGVLSTMSSAASKAAGEIVEPLYREATKFLSWASGPSGFRMDGVTEALKESVRKISKDVFTYLQLNGQSMINRLGEAFLTLADAAKNAVAYIRQNGNAIAGAVKSMVDWGLAIAKWMADHPRLMAAIVALKLAFATGIPQAITATLAAFTLMVVQMGAMSLLFQKVFGVSAITLVVRLGTRLLAFSGQIGVVRNAVLLLNSVGFLSGWAGVLEKVAAGITAVNVALTLLKGVVIGFLLVAVGKIAQWAAEWDLAADGVKSVNERIEESIRLTEELLALRGRLRGTEISRILSNPDRDAAAAEAQRRLTQAQLAKSSTAIKIQGLEAFEKKLWLLSFGSDKAAAELEEVRLQLEEERKVLEDATNAVRDWQQALGQINQERGKPPEGAAPPAPGAPQGGGAVPPPTTTEKKKENEVSAEQKAKWREEEAKSPIMDGFAALAEKVATGTIEEILDFYAGIEGVTGENVAYWRKGLEEYFADLEKERQERTAAQKKLLEEGKISQEQHDKEIQKIEKDIAKKRQDEAAGSAYFAIRSANDNADKNRAIRNARGDEDRLLTPEVEASLPREQVDEFRRSIMGLVISLESGDISAKGYTEAIKKIQKQIEDSIRILDKIKENKEEWGEIAKDGLSPAFQKAFDEINKQAEKGILDPKAYDKAFGTIKEKAREFQQAEKEFGKLREKGYVDPAYEAEYKKLQEALESGAMGAKEYAEAISGITGRIQAEQAAAKDIKVLGENGPISSEMSAAYGKLLQDLRTKKITVDQFNESMGQLTQKIQEGQQAFGVFKDLMDGLFGQTFGMASQAAQQLQAQFAFLQQQLDTDKISIAEFRKQVQLLAQASERAAAAERRRRLINGDFQGAGLNLWEAVLDKIANMRMEQFDLMATNWANQLTGLGGMFQQVGDDLNYWRQQVGDFANSLPGGGDVANVWNTISNFLASLEGQRQAALAQIQLLRQSLQVTEDALSRKDLQGKIDELIRQLQVLDQQQANLPTFVADRGELDFKDPGLSGGGSNRSNKSGSVTITLPNVTRISQTDAEVMANIVAREMQRRGRTRT